MSIQTEIDRIIGHVSAAHEKVKAKGGTTTTPYLIANLPAAIESIPEATDPVLQQKTVTPSTSAQSVKPDSGYDGLSEVTVAGDSNLVASNIKSGVSIFGVAGTLTEGGASVETCTVTVTSSLIADGMTYCRIDAHISNSGEIAYTQNISYKGGSSRVLENVVCNSLIIIETMNDDPVPISSCTTTNAEELDYEFEPGSYKYWVIKVGNTDATISLE